ncbi:hypothetical protein [Paraburkholderia sp. BL10I2N1]|uniref:hypothetical protein n=1 Tax=Paraburkholderia sp. BL10I2N1 TaxID=1938796 RepID=UPI00105B4687|nr:hypothetical protein [Paraburkholderia sp. BL10I2N1]TDN70163.1 hypothetical protein B0G77_3617 [Paraburkholderia sp. BL10I2N1]
MTNATALILDGLRHPARTVRRHWTARDVNAVSGTADPAPDATDVRHSPERLERIAAYARCGYFHMDYTAGMFVVPLDIPPE